jgi:hypothetical protein
MVSIRPLCFWGMFYCQQTEIQCFFFFWFLLAGEIVVVYVFSLDLCQKPVKPNVPNICVHRLYILLNLFLHSGTCDLLTLILSILIFEYLQCVGT